MKIRSNIASCGRCISDSFRWIEDLRKNVPEPDSYKTQDQIEDRVATGVKPFFILRESQRLQTEGGKSRVAAAKARHEKVASRRANKPSPFRCSQRREEPYK